MQIAGYYGIVEVERCVFSGNTGALCMDYLPQEEQYSTGLALESCRFIENQLINNQPTGKTAGIWAEGTFSAVNCLFRDNGGGAIVTQHDSGSRIVNCTFVRNIWHGDIDALGIWLRGTSPLGRGIVQVQNCILWENDDGNGNPTELDQLKAAPGLGQYLLEGVSFTCIQNLNVFEGNGNIGSGASFDAGLDEDHDDLPLEPDSPCVDAGFNLVDIDPWTPGFQPLPPTDLRGYPRISAGSSGATPTVDMGACERPPLPPSN
jgi:hypothetical protein